MSSAPSARRRRPNVLLIIVDDLRPDLGVYRGDPSLRTPRIDALAARSTLFMQAHAAVANCAPSRSSFLTGLRPDTHGVMDLVTHIRDILPHVVTLPQRFREAGYLSVSYGKIFHQKLDDAPSWSPQRDFPDNHTYRGLRGRAWLQAGGWDGWRYNHYMLAANREAMKRKPEAGFYSNVPPYERGPSHNPQGHGTTDARIAASAVAALRRLRAQRLPWLLAVGFVRPHLPFSCPSSFFDAVSVAALPHVPSEGAPIGASALTRAHLSHGNGELFDFKGARAKSGGSRAGGSRAGAADPQALRHAYAACVSFADAQAGRVLAALGTGALAARTLVVLMSDHGWKLGHHGAWGKHTLMAADTRVPLLLHVPWLASSHGTRVDTPVELIDLYPTLLQLAALPPSPISPPFQGRSLLPLLRATANARATAYASGRRGLTGRANGSAFGAVAIIPSGTQRRDAAECGGCAELYAMPSNGTGGDAPHFELERHNVIEQHREVVFRLRAMLRAAAA